MFAIYFAAVTSITEEQCQASLDMDKTSLLKKYRFATQQALARSGFLSADNVVALQALVIFLVRQNLASFNFNKHLADQVVDMRTES